MIPTKNLLRIGVLAVLFGVLLASLTITAGVDSFGSSVAFAGSCDTCCPYYYDCSTAEPPTPAVSDDPQPDDDDDDDDAPPPNPDPSVEALDAPDFEQLYSFEGGTLLGAFTFAGFHDYVLDTFEEFDELCVRVVIYKISDQGGILDLWDDNYECFVDEEGVERFLRLRTAGTGTYVFFLATGNVQPPLRLAPLARLGIEPDARDFS